MWLFDVWYLLKWLFDMSSLLLWLFDMSSLLMWLFDMFSRSVSYMAPEMERDGAASLATDM
jgi:hypothetical protein